jgi:hypothetical protein
VQAEARYYHATVIPSEQFALQIHDTHQRVENDSGNDSNVSLTYAEIQEWLQYFDRARGAKENTKKA